MINTFLFDLDGTLLPLEWEVFEKEYFKGLAMKLKDHFEPEQLIKYIWKSTMKMIENTGGIKTNKEVFFEDFVQTTGKSVEILNPLFDEFYTKEFKQLGRLVKSEPYIIKTIELLLERGYEIVVATNALFPRQAIKTRINWAGLDEKHFRYITCFEEMHYCKPSVNFFSEILHKINKKPEECIMIGNDVQEDLIAGELGIKTFLVEDYIINEGGETPNADYKGLYKDLYEFVLDNFPYLSK